VGSENRKHKRIASLNLLHVEVYREGGLIKQGAGRTLNISESGILLEIHFSIDTDDIVHISIGLKEDLLEIKGKSIRCMQAENGKYNIGILFDRITDVSAEKILMGYIEAFKSGK
jgi:hypothetical protein